jgi:hypothetical protein
MNPSIVEGRFVADYFVFYPYSADLPGIESDECLQEYVPTYYSEDLNPVKTKLAGRRTLQNSNLHWWDLLRHRAWQEEPAPKLVSKYFGERKAFAFDDVGNVVVVVGQAWMLKKDAHLSDQLTDEEVYLAMLAYLSSSLADHLIGYLSVQVAGGQWDLSHKYLKDLPVPNLAKIHAARVNELVQIGRNILSGADNGAGDVDEIMNSIFLSRSKNG